MGVNPEFVERELAAQAKAAQRKNVTAAAKSQNDRALISGWLKKYRTRLALDLQGLTGAERDAAENERAISMNKVNPRVVLRFVVQCCIFA